MRTSHLPSPSHPLSGPECWPRSGPVYGLEFNDEAGSPSLWRRVSEWLEGEPPTDDTGPDVPKIFY